MISLQLCFVFVYVAGAADHSGGNRDKRFFQNLQSYFSKSSTTASPTEAQRNVRILGSGSSRNLCSHNCTEAKFGPYDASTPVAYLTPPTPQLDKSVPADFGHKYAPSSGYSYDGGAFQPTFFNGTRDFLLANEKGTVHVLPFSTETEPDLLKVKLKDMWCVKSPRSGRFSLQMVTSKSLPAPPIIENGYSAENLPQCSVTTVDQTAFRVNLEEPDMIRCGLYYCDSDLHTNLMCLTLRFPQINGLRTSNDIIMRIECHPQQQILSQISQFKVKPNFSNGRSLPIYGTIIGGNPNQALRSQVGLYAMTETGYTQLLGNDDVVSVGQHLQLRSTVNSGDGWNYSRFGQILIQKQTSPVYGYGSGENLDSVVVVADDGCVNLLMTPICPVGPFNDPADPLISLLNIQMFEFNNMRDGDEISISVTIYGCVHHEDCFQKNNQQCRNWPARYKRSSSLNMTESTSEIKIRVRSDQTKNDHIRCNENGCTASAIVRKIEYYLIFLFFILLNMVILSGYLLYYYARSKWRQNLF